MTFDASVQVDMAVDSGRTEVDMLVITPLAFTPSAIIVNLNHPLG
jgi:hypothetical protein